MCSDPAAPAQHHRCWLAASEAAAGGSLAGDTPTTFPLSTFNPHPPPRPTPNVHLHAGLPIHSSSHTAAHTQWHTHARAHRRITPVQRHLLPHGYRRHCVTESLPIIQYCPAGRCQGHSRAGHMLQHTRSRHLRQAATAVRQAQRTPHPKACQRTDRQTSIPHVETHVPHTTRDPPPACPVQVFAFL